LFHRQQGAKDVSNYDLRINFRTGDYEVVRLKPVTASVQCNIKTREKAERALALWQEREKSVDRGDKGL
jgi:hypothetical protein